MILVLGGQHETQKGVTRPDILLYNAQKRCWVTSLKQAVRIKAGCCLHDVIQVNNFVYLMIKPLAEESNCEGIVERINLEVACQEYRLDKVGSDWSIFVIALLGLVTIR